MSQESPSQWRDAVERTLDAGSGALGGAHPKAVVNNTDNHLRNHGLLAEGAGWRVAPAFDINPNPDLGAYRSTALAGSALPMNTSEGIVALASYAGISDAQRRSIVADIVAAVRQWREVAESNGVGHEIERLAPSIDAMIARVHAAGA